MTILYLPGVEVDGMRNTLDARDMANRPDIYWLWPRYEQCYGRKDPAWPGSRDEAAWQSMYKRAFAVLKNHEARIVVDHMKQIRYAHLQDLIQTESEARRWKELGWLAGWLRGEIQRAKDECGDACIDNERWADVRKSSQVRRYKKKKANGCCGSHDEVVTHWLTRRRFLIGFNYGH